MGIIELSVPGDISWSFTEEEALTMKVRLWQFLSAHTERYTFGDSTSVPVEKAQELLSSICFVLDVYLADSGQSRKLLVTGDMDVMFDLGIKIIESKIEAGRQLWQTACMSAPQIKNTSYRDTLESIGNFFKCYDYRFFAHQIPCAIDYQLCLPVPESMLGIEYINEYLRRIVFENLFLKLFDIQLIIRLLEKYCPDYKGLLINLFLPVMTNALGLTLIGQNALSLKIANFHRTQLADLFEPLGEMDARELLKTAAGQLCRALGILGNGERDYLEQSAQALYPRIAAALPSNNMNGIFISFI